MTARHTTQRPKPTKAPARRAARQRSAEKARASAHPSQRRYTDEQKAQAVSLCTEQGTAAAHRELGVPKSTLSRWCKAAGVDLTAAALERTRAAAQHTRARSAEVSASTVELLEQHIAQAGDYLATVAGVNALAARRIIDADPDTIAVERGLNGPYAVLGDKQAQEVAKVALALAGLPLAARDAEGILTRAIHDLQLLRGEATERGELVVEFNVPRPAANSDRDAVVVEPTAIEGAK